MKLKIAAVQFNPVDGDLDHNLKTIETRIAKAAVQGADLVLLPEICDIGYSFKDIKRLALPFPNRSTDFFSKLSSGLNVIIVAGLSERRDDGIYNTAALFSRSGERVGVYDKTHLCPIPPIDEPSFFKAGKELKTFDIGGIKIGVTICYEIRFPEIYRKLALDGAQLIVHPTAFPRMRIEQHEITLRTRAHENQFFIASANPIGVHGGVELGGRSMIVDPEGKMLAEASETDETLILTEINLDDVERIRREKPIFTQRHPSLY